MIALSAGRSVAEVGREFFKYSPYISTVEMYGEYLKNSLPTSAILQRCCHSDIICVWLISLTSAINVDSLPSLKVLASCAASLASLPASSFPAIELCPGAQLISTALQAPCRVLIAFLVSLVMDL